MAKAKRKPSFNVDTFLSTVNGGRSVSKYQKNQKIFHQGDPADSVFYIQEGKVKVCVISERGKEAVVAIHGKGDFFGEGCLTGQPLRLATVMAMTDCVIMRLEKTSMVNVIRDEPKFSAMFMAYLLTRKARVEADLIDQLFNLSEKRLARLLLLMANFGQEGKPEPVITKVSQETLAEMVGTTRVLRLMFCFESCVDGAHGSRGSFGFLLAVGCKSCVRPVCAALMTAGPDVIRRSGPYQNLALYGA